MDLSVKVVRTGQDKGVDHRVAVVHIIIYVSSTKEIAIETTAVAKEIFPVPSLLKIGLINCSLGFSIDRCRWSRFARRLEKIFEVNVIGVEMS